MPKGSKVAMVKDVKRIGVVTKRKKTEHKWAVDFSQSKGKSEVWVHETEIKVWEEEDPKSVKKNKEGR